MKLLRKITAPKESLSALPGGAREEEIRAICRLLGMISVADGALSEAAVPEIDRFISAQVTSDQREFAHSCLMEGRRDPLTAGMVTKLAFQLYGFREDSGVERTFQPLQILDILMRVALADRIYSVEEEYIVDRTRSALGVHIRSFWILRDTLSNRLGIEVRRESASFADAREARQKARAKTTSQPAKNLTRARAFDVLGVAADAAEPEIKTAYRALVKKFHPDALRRENGEESVIREAIENFYRVQEAYEFLMRT